MKISQETNMCKDSLYWKKILQTTLTPLVVSLELTLTTS